MLINEAFAQTATASMPAQNSFGALFVQIVLIFLVVYFILIRPQQKKMKQHEAKLMAIKTGDYVITGGGLLAKVISVNGESLEISLSDNNIVTAVRMTVRDVLSKEEAETLLHSDKKATAAAPAKTKTKKKK